MLRETGKET